MQCGKCGSVLTPGQRFCGSCGTPAPPPGDPPCPNCGAPMLANARFCPACGRPAGAAPPVAATVAARCQRCGAELVLGMNFCRACGTPVGAPAAVYAQPAAAYQPPPAYAPPVSGWPAAAPKRGIAWSPATIIALAGLVAVVVSVYLPWAKAGPITVSALDEGARFRLGDWQGKDNLDGYLVAAFGLVALLMTLLGARQGAGSAAWRQTGGLVGGLLIPLGIMEIQFTLSQKGVDLGYGLYVLMGGAITTSVARMFPGAK